MKLVFQILEAHKKDCRAESATVVLVAGTAAHRSSDVALSRTAASNWRTSS